MRYAYQFKTSGGSGTWISDIKPEEAKKELIKRFPEYKFISLRWINGSKANKV
jgi:hypothetical protein